MLIELLVIELCVNKWLIFNWIFIDTYQYMEPFNSVQMEEVLK